MKTVEATVISLILVNQQAYYHREKSKAWQNDISKIDNWKYDEKEDAWTCTAGQTLVFRYESKEKTESGFDIQHRHYRRLGCEGCPLKTFCTKATGNREIKVSMLYIRFKQQMREKLRGFRRFLLRDLPKVRTGG